MEFGVCEVEVLISVVELGASASLGAGSGVVVGC